MSDEENGKKASIITFRQSIHNMDCIREVEITIQSQTDEGAWIQFERVRAKMDVTPFPVPDKTRKT